MTFYSKKLVKPHLPGNPDAVQADPRMLLTNTGEEKGQRRGTKEVAGKIKEVNKVKSLSGDGLLGLQTPFSWLHCTLSGHKDKQKIVCPLLLLSRDHAVDGLSLLQLLLHLNHELDTVNHQLDLVHLGGAQTVSVGDVEHATHGGSVHTTWMEYT